MAAQQMNFGSILRDERERKHLDLTMVARRLRIRPDILEAIEDADFSRMPPRGYTRNMVNAYAHFLGLNATEITRMYLDECYQYQVGNARHGSRSSSFDMGPRHGGVPHGELRNNGSGRRRFSDGYRTEETSRMQRMGRGQGRQSRSGRSSNSAVEDIQYSNFYSGSRSTQVRPASKLPFIIAGVIILVLVVIVCVLLFGPKRASAPTEQQVMPVTGIDEQGSSSSSSSTEGSQESQQAQAVQETPPTSTKVEYSVADGAQVYLEVYVDGTAEVADDVTGPQSESFDVTGTIQFNVVANEGEVTITQDGKEVALVDDDGNGVMNLTIDFADVLRQWNADHPQAASANGGNAAGESSSSSSEDAVSGSNADSSAGSDSGTEESA